MRTRIRTALVGGLTAGLFLTAGALAFAGAHTWDFVEVFRNADGSIWFIEMLEPTPAGSGVEWHVGNLPVVSMAAPADNFAICIHSEDPPVSCDLVLPITGTGQKRMLFASPGYAELAALQGAPAPDQVVTISGFFNTTGETLRYNTGPPTYDQWVVPGTVPTDGVNSMNRVGGSLANTPQNYLGATGSINATTLPPSVVPNGSGGTAMTVAKLVAPGLRISYDVNTCALNNNHNVIYGEKSDLPTLSGGTFSIAGSVCAIGGTSPFVWSTPPDATDGSGLIWWLILVSNDSTAEGSWGVDSQGAERLGPGGGGESLECGVAAKDLTNTCGG